MHAISRYCAKCFMLWLFGFCESPWANRTCSCGLLSGELDILLANLCAWHTDQCRKIQRKGGSLENTYSGCRAQESGATRRGDWAVVPNQLSCCSVVFYFLCCLIVHRSERQAGVIIPTSTNRRNSQPRGKLGTTWHDKLSLQKLLYRQLLYCIC